MAAILGMGANGAFLKEASKIMGGSAWVVVVAIVFVLVVLALVGMLVMGRLRGRNQKADAVAPERVPHPRGEAIPPTGSR